MKNRLVALIDTHLGSFLTVAAVLLYLALLAGRGSLGPAYGPAVGLPALVVLGLVLRRLQTGAALGARLRVDAWALILGGLLLLALVLRMLHGPQEVPAPGTDEAYFMESALGIIRSGKYIPASLRHPTLLVYVELATSVLRFLTGASRNLWTWPSDLTVEPLYGWGRAVVALLGAVTLVPAFLVGERRYDRRAGLLAALFLALVPMHLVASRTVSPEVIAALLALSATWCSLRLLQEGTHGWALAAGACAGLALATHYPAFPILLVPPLAALLRVKKDERGGPVVLLAVVGAAVAFVVACPAALFKLDRLVAGMAEAVRVYFPPEGGSAGTGLKYLLLQGLGPGAFLLTAAGAGLSLFRPRREDVVLYLFPVATFAVLLLPHVRFSGDLVMLAPWAALLSAVAVDRLAAWLQARWTARPALQRWVPWGVAAVTGVLYLSILLV